MRSIRLEHSSATVFIENRPSAATAAAAAFFDPVACSNAYLRCSASSFDAAPAPTPLNRCDDLDPRDSTVVCLTLAKCETVCARVGAISHGRSAFGGPIMRGAIPD